MLLDYELGVLRVVCNANPDRKVLVEKNYPDTQFTTDFEELLQRSDIGAVATSTQTVYHYDILKMALMNDKDTVVEKPLALTVAEGS